MAVNLSPVGGVAGQFFDNNGNPLSGGKIFTYAAGTTTNQVTYTSATGVTAHSNPIILDSGGRVPSGEIWLTDGLQYKFVIQSSTNQLIGTFDNVTGINSNFVNYTIQEEIQTATAGQTVFTLTTMSYAPATNSLSVFVDGVNQYGGGAYSYIETDSTTVTFTAGLHVGAEVKFTTAVFTAGSVGNAANVVYDPAGVGAVPTNVQDKLRETVSVKDFGAVGDGVTDDKAAVKLALESGFIVDGGGLTYAIDGTCAPTSFVGLQNANFIQIGDNSTTNFNTLSIVGFSNFFIDNVTINMGTNVSTLFSDDGNNALYVAGAAYNNSSKNFNITRVTVTGNGCGAGIHVRHAERFTVSNCLVHDRISGSSPDPTNDSQNGIQIVNCANFVLSDSNVYNLRSRLSGVDTVRFTRGFLFAEIRDASIVGCNATTVDQGFDFSGAYDAGLGYIGNRRWTIGNCTANVCNTFGFKFANVTRDGLVTGCIANNTGSIGFVFSPSSATLPVGLEKYNTQNIDVVGCKVVNALGTGASGTNATGFRMMAGSTYTTYPRSIRLKNCSVIDTQDIATTTLAYGSDVVLPTAPAEDTANTTQGCTFSNNITNGFTTDIGPNLCQVTGSTTQAIANNTQTILNWNQNLTDPLNLHDTTTDNSRVYVKTSGWYEVKSQVQFDEATSGQYQVRLKRNGSVIPRTTMALAAVSTAAPASLSTSTLIYLVTTDYIEVEAFQNTGVSQNARLNESHFNVKLVS
jgi:hypothetical protein